MQGINLKNKCYVLEKHGPGGEGITKLMWTGVGIRLTLSNANVLNNKRYVLEKRGPVKVLVDFPDFTQTSHFDTANDCNCNKTTDHHCRLKHVGPHYSLQSTLMENQN